MAIEATTPLSTSSSVPPLRISSGGAWWTATSRSSLRGAGAARRRRRRASLRTRRSSSASICPRDEGHRHRDDVERQRAAGPAAAVPRRAISRHATSSSPSRCPSRDRLPPLRRKGEDVEDLVQVASIGLLKAIDKFDLDRDVRMVAYIFPTVVGELKRHFRDRVWSVTSRAVEDLNQLLSRHLEEPLRRSAARRRSPSLRRPPASTRRRCSRRSRPARVHDTLLFRRLRGRRGRPRADRRADERGGGIRREREPRSPRGGVARTRRARAHDHPSAFLRGATQSQVAVQLGTPRCMCRG